VNRNAFIFALIALTMLLSDVRAQSAIEAGNKDPIAAGFANTVSDLLARMQGEWRIKSATLMGADLPLDQFDSLTVDDKGFTLKIQKTAARFTFAEFELESKRFLAKCASPDYPKGLTDDIRISDDSIQIRYRINGSEVAPEAKSKDNQLFVQTWKK
jgi:hypothetical protein